MFATAHQQKSLGFSSCCFGQVKNKRSLAFILFLGLSNKVSLLCRVQSTTHVDWTKWQTDWRNVCLVRWDSCSKWWILRLSDFQPGYERMNLLMSAFTGLHKVERLSARQLQKLWGLCGNKMGWDIQWRALQLYSRLHLQSRSQPQFIFNRKNVSYVSINYRLRRTQGWTWPLSVNLQHLRQVANSHIKTKWTQMCLASGHQQCCWFTGRGGEYNPWKSVDNDWYQFNYLTRRTWTEAYNECADQGGNLASITDPNQMALILGAKFLQANTEPEAELKLNHFCSTCSSLLWWGTQSLYLIPDS